MVKESLSLRILDSPIVKDGIKAISKLEGYSVSAGHYLVVGGMAVQSYLPTFCRRPTADIDLVVDRRLSNEREFRNFAKPVFEYLKDNGLKVEEVPNHNWELLVKPKKHRNEYLPDDAILLSFPNISEEDYLKKKVIIEKELRKYRVVSPEFIVIPKMARLGKVLMRNYKLKPLIVPYTTELTKEKIWDTIKNKVSDIKLSTLEKRIICDAYDIRVLSEQTGFNEEDVKDAITSWPERLDLKSVLKNREIFSLLPKIKGLD